MRYFIVFTFDFTFATLLWTLGEDKASTTLWNYTTTNLNAPLLYTPKFILLFGTLFSVFAGGILMAINFSQLGKRKYVLFVLLLSFLYSAIQVVTFNLMPIKSSSLTLATSMLGIYLLEQVLWKKYVQVDLKYRKRSIWAALIIAIIFWTPIFYLMLVNR